MRKNLEKLFAVILVLTLVFTMAACGNSDDNSGTENSEKYTLSATWCAGEATAIVQSWYKAAEKIEQDSNGRIQVKTYHTGQISGSDRENAEKVSTNVCQFTTIPCATMAEFSGIKEYNLSTIPYICTSDAQLDYLYDQGVYDDINAEFTAQTGLVPNGSFSTGWVALGMKKGEVRSAAELKGMKIRSMTTEGQLSTLEAWGAAPTPMAIGELFTALQQGTVDGALAAEQLFDSEGYGEILASITNINPFSTYHIGIYNQDWYNDLPDDLKTVFDEGMAYFYEVCRPAQLQATEDAYKNLEADGCKFVELTADELQGFADAAASVTEKMSADLDADFVQKAKDCLATM